MPVFNHRFGDGSAGSSANRLGCVTNTVRAGSGAWAVKTEVVMGYSAA